MAALPGWGALYLAADIALAAFMLRHDLRRRGRAAVIAMTELLGGVCLSLPAWAYLDADFAALMDAAALRILFALGLAALLVFGWRDLRTGLRDPLHARLAPRRRWLLFLLGPVLPLAASIPEVWWAALALH